MKTKSAKAKGRKAAAELQKLLLKTFPQLEPNDVRITPSGVHGEDLQLSPRAREVLPYAFEVKNKERLNIWDAFKQCKVHVKDHNSRPIVAFRRNNAPFHVCMEMDTFLELIAG